MKKKCSIDKLFDEFKLNVKGSFFGIKKFNGFIKVKNYEKHIINIVNNFRHDMYYQLAFEKDIKREVFLRNLFNELNYTKNNLNSSLNYFHINFCNSKWAMMKLIKSIINKYNCRRIKYMYYKQKNGINKLIEILIISAESYNINLKENNISHDRLVCNSKWVYEKLALIQLIIAHIYSNTLEVPKENELIIIKEIASFFGVDYNHTLETSLIHSIFDRKEGYEPKIFDELKKGYKKYENLRKQHNKISRA